LQPGPWTRSVPAATLALALASTIGFVAFVPRDRQVLQTAANFYVESGLAAIELPLYRDYLQQSADSDAMQRLAQLERATDHKPGRPADPAMAIELLHGDPGFEQDLRAGRIVQASDPAFAQWQRDRQRLDELMGSSPGQSFALTGQAWTQPWRLVTYLFLHQDAAQWLTDLLVLLLLGPFAEAAAGPLLLLLCYLGAGAVTGAIHLLLSRAPMTGQWGALAGLTGLLVTMFPARRIPGQLLWTRWRVAVPGFAALLVLLGVEALRWAWGSRSAIDATADLSGLASGAVMVLCLKLRDSRRAKNLMAQARSAEPDSHKESGLARQAREAATRMDTRRASHLFKELVDLEPQRIEHLCAYLNVALLAPDETTLQDAALRLLWLRSRSHSDEMRKAFLQLTQPKVLKVLPIDEHLRLARRLVRIREDAAALRVLDAILSDSHLRQLYGRQLADCLLDTGAALVENFWKESGHVSGVGSIRDCRTYSALARGVAI